MQAGASAPGLVAAFTTRAYYLGAASTNMCGTAATSCCLQCVLVKCPCRFNVSAAGVAQRDAAVWQFAQRLQAPIMMVLSGGYTRASAGVIVDSLSAILQDIADKYGSSSSGGNMSGPSS